MQNPEQSADPTDFPAYPAYKPSGVQWLGDIPSHWEVWRLKYLARNISQPTSERVDGELRLGLEHVESWTGKYEIAENVRFESKMKRFQPDDVLFGKLRPYLAKVTRPDRAGLCMGDFLVFRSKSKIMVAGFLEYLLRCKYVIDLIDSSAVGAKMPRADWNFIGNVWLPLPPLPEQRAIAAYLDRKGDIARRYAHVARHIIDTLRELRQVEIHDAVTRGLNEDIPLKPSGVEWLGDVPEHWDVRWLKFWVDTNKRTLSEKTDPNFQFRYIEIGGVSEGALLNEPAAIRFGSAPSRARRIVRQGDTIVSTVRTYLKAVWFADDEADDLVCSTGFAVLTPKVDAFPKFVSYVVQSDAFIHQVMANSVGVAYPAISVSKLRVLYVPVPPIAEQRAIAEYLDAKTAAIDAAIAHYERMAALVAEYWTVLVADAVTGRIDLRQESAE